MRTIQDMIAAEVRYCVSALVSELAGTLASPLGEQAVELASPILDYEEAAREAGWGLDDSGPAHNELGSADEWSDACELSGVEPHEREVFEHWAVTDWFAEELEAAGEKVDRDFAGMCVWARTTTGQAIYADAVIERIYAETMAA